MNRNEIIKKYRIAADLSWMEMANLIGIDKRYAVLIFNGHANPGPRTEHRIQRWYTRNRADIEAAIAELEPING